MLTKYLSVFLISMVPLIELRGAIPDVYKRQLQGFVCCLGNSF